MFNFEQFSRPKLFYPARYGGEENRAQQLPFHGSAVDFNIVSPGTPGTTVPAPSTFGIIRSAQAMRQLQFGLRLLF
jgi:hypothetical protein